MLTDRFINPFTDFGFKKLFGEEPNKDLLIDFLNQLLAGEEKKIKKLRYINSGQLGNTKIDRKAIYDLYCENEKGEKFIVELQKAKQNFFKDRSVFYSTFPIQEQAIPGDWNFQLKAVYTIGILDFVFEDDKADEEKFHYTVKLTDIKSQKVFYEKLTFIYLEMPKYKKGVKDLKTRFDKWLYVLKNLPKLQERPKKLQGKIFEKLFKTAEIAQFTPEERQQYESSLKYYRDLNNVVDTAREEGKEEGYQLGEEAGLEKGKEEGKKAEALKIAKAMKEKGTDSQFIAETTGLSPEIIETL